MTTSNVLRMLFSWAWAAPSVPHNDTPTFLVGPRRKAGYRSDPDYTRQEARHALGEDLLLRDQAEHQRGALV